MFPLAVMCESKEAPPPLLKNTLYCAYCEHNLPFNEYYKHYVDCKNGFLNNNKKYGELLERIISV